MKKKQKEKLKRIIISTVIFLLVYLSSLILNALNVDFIPNKKILWIIPLIIYLSIYVYAGYDVYYKAYLALKNKQFFDEKILVIIASISIFITGIFYSTINETVRYIATPVLYMILYQFVIILESVFADRYRNLYNDFSRIKEEIVLKKTRNNYETQTIESIRVNDVIVINPETVIPVDGIIVKGKTTINYMPVLGIDKKTALASGDFVCSGAYNEEETIEIKVKEKYFDSKVYKIVNFTDNESKSLSIIERLIKKLDKFYSPIMLIFSVLIAFIPPMFDGNHMGWILRSINILVISSTYQLFNSVILAFSYGLTNASLNHVLIKNANYLEKLSKVKTFIFDKTGTLTNGHFSVANVFPQKSRNIILRYACEAHYNSTKPISEALRGAYKANYDKGYQIITENELGIVAKKNKNIIICGNERLMLEHDIKYLKNDSIGTILYLAFNKKFLGTIVISDEVRPEASSLLSYLSTSGAKIIMLTRDNEAVSSSLADRLMLDDYKCQLLSQDKKRIVNEYKNNKDKNDVVCYIGSKHDELELFKEADLGIILEAGSMDDELYSLPYVFVLGNDLNQLQKAVEISKRTLNVIYFDFISDMILRIAIILLSLFGIINIWVAILLEMASMLVFVINIKYIDSK